MQHVMQCKSVTTPKTGKVPASMKPFYPFKVHLPNKMAEQKRRRTLRDKPDNNYV